MDYVLDGERVKTETLLEDMELVLRGIHEIEPRKPAEAVEGGFDSLHSLQDSKSAFVERTEHNHAPDFTVEVPDS
jgi:hypothetical protein